MTQTIFVLFAIPIVSILVVVLIQFLDEMFKKKFVIERRGSSSSVKGSIKRLSTAPPTSDNRRYSDLVPAGALRNSDPEASGSDAEGLETQVHAI